jgi:hypothetical protein
MNKSELKANVEATGSNYFDRDSMRFFGDTMKNYGVRSAVVDTYTQTSVDCWELYRIHPVKHENQKSAYFRKDNFERVHPKLEA